MRTSGKGNDLLMFFVPGGVLAFFVLWLFGGPTEFFRWLNTTVGNLADLVSSYF